MVTEPEVLLLDEPFADLDQEGIDMVCRAIAKLPRSTVLVASPLTLPAGLKARTYVVKSQVSRVPFDT
jgi:energy-coupling factor transporter ATP-binding protein EcfA2